MRIPQNVTCIQYKGHEFIYTKQIFLFNLIRIEASE